MIITQAEIIHHQLQFKFEAGTSRGTLTHKDSWYLKLFNGNEPIGIGEAGPLKGLSVDPIEEVEQELNRVGKLLVNTELPSNTEAVFDLASELISPSYPSIRFALETALLDAINGGKRQVFETDFYNKEKRIPINGLVWMGTEAFMREQIEEKLAAGYNCIKIKIGAIDFETELKLLKSIREKYSQNEITLRVDANGSFGPDEALDKLTQLAEFDLHSIEQPIKAGQIDEMTKLCASTPFPIALDEELIGVNSYTDKEDLLQTIKPQYIILKPSLIGGIQSTLEWIEIAKSMNIGWWMTSMLESNIGLNAICQLASYLKVSIPQGLGTGQLYHNNIKSPLTIANGEIYYDKSIDWGEIQ